MNRRTFLRRASAIAAGGVAVAAAFDLTETVRDSVRSLFVLGTGRRAPYDFSITVEYEPALRLVRTLRQNEPVIVGWNAERSAPPPLVFRGRWGEPFILPPGIFRDNALVSMEKDGRTVCTRVQVGYSRPLPRVVMRYPHYVTLDNPLAFIEGGAL